MKPRAEDYNDFLQAEEIRAKRFVFVRWLSLFTILVSALVLIWLSLPQMQQQVVLEVSPSGFVPIEDAGEFHISLPTMLRIGQPSEITLILQDVKRIDGGSGEMGLLVEARLDMPGVGVFPQGTVRQTLTEGQLLRFVWRCTPYSQNKFSGTLWVFINTVSENGQLDRYPILAYPLEIQAKRGFGIPVQLIRLLCFVGLFSGMLMLLYQKLRRYFKPFFISEELIQKIE